MIHRAKGEPPKELFGTTGTSRYFRGSAPWANVFIWTLDGKQLLDMEGWEQAEYNHKDGTAPLANDFCPTGSVVVRRRRRRRIAGRRALLWSG